MKNMLFQGRDVLRGRSTEVEPRLHFAQADFPADRHSKSIKEGLAGFLADFQKAHSICTRLADLWIMEEVRYRSCNIFNNAKCSQTIWKIVLWICEMFDILMDIYEQYIVKQLV